MATVTWKITLVRRNPAKGVAVLLFIIVLSVFTGMLTQSALMTLLALVVLSASVAQYFIPVTYDLDDKGVKISMLLHHRYREWGDFKRWETDGKSIKLLTMKTPSRLDNYRGWLLITEPGTRQEVMNLVGEKLK